VEVLSGRLLAAGERWNVRSCRGGGRFACAFDILSEQLHGDSSHARKVPAKVVEYLGEDPDDFKPFIDAKAGMGHKPFTSSTKLTCHPSRECAGNWTKLYSSFSAIIFATLFNFHTIFTGKTRAISKVESEPQPSLESQEPLVIQESNPYRYTPVAVEHIKAFAKRNVRLCLCEGRYIRA
jgi:hypothetical protein